MHIVQTAAHGSRTAYAFSSCESLNNITISPYFENREDIFYDCPNLSWTYIGATTVSNEYDLITVDGSTHKYKKYKDITEKNITLTYFHFDQDETVKKLADRFMQIYPNITVNVQYEDTETYNTTLSTLASNNETPDIIMHSDCDYVLSNMLLTDISAYFNLGKLTFHGLRHEFATTCRDWGVTDNYIQSIGGRKTALVIGAVFLCGEL